MIGETSPDNTTSNKRSSEELGSNHDSAKRPRINTTPSKVIHIRNVPHEVLEAELYTLCAPFGKVVTAVIMKGKGQALVQMQDQAGATALVDFYSKNPAMLRTNLIHLQYSTRDELTNKPPGQTPATSSSSSRPLLSQPPPPGSQSESRNESCILLVNITNVSYPITIELLHSVFSKYGIITKIVVFNKTGIQAFIQFASSAVAEIAKHALDGQNIYVGCCTLRINFSTIKDLDIKYNNEKSRDFTNPYLPASGAASQDHLPPPYAPPMQPPAHLTYPPVSSNWAYPAAPLAPEASPVVIVSGLNDEKITPDTLFTLFGVYGDVLKVKILFNKKDTALVQLSSAQHAESAIKHLNGAVVQGKPIRINYSKHVTIMTPSNSIEENPQFTKEYVGSPLHRFKSPNNPFKHVCPPSSTLHVSSIPATITETDLRELFAEYGEVANVKFFPSEKRMALVQMGNVPEATQALISLHNHKFDSSLIPIRISFAKSTIYI